MRVLSLVLLFISGILNAQQPVQGVPVFRGTISYQMTENGQAPRLFTYFFSDTAIKKIDTSDTHAAQAGFTEFIWNLKQKKEYSINHATRTVYVKELILPGQGQINYDTATHQKVAGYECFTFKKSDSAFFDYKSIPDTMINHRTFFFTPVLRVTAFLTDGIKGAEPLGLFMGYIPVSMEAKGKLQSQPEGYHTSTRILEIKTRAVSSEQFVLPKGYIIKAYNESQIRREISRAIEKEVNFLDQVRQIMRDKGMLDE